MKLYKKIKSSTCETSFLLGLPVSYKKKADDRIIISRFFGLSKKISKGFYIYTYICGIRINKSPNISKILENDTQNNQRMFQDGQNCLNSVLKNINNFGKDAKKEIEAIKKQIQSIQLRPSNVNIDVDNLLLKINRLIMSDISTAKIHTETFGPFRGCFRGKKVALIGTGPTLNNFSPDDLDSDTIYVGCNAAFKYTDCDYLFAQDYPNTKPFFDDFLAYRPNRCIKFLAQLPEMITEYTNNCAETIYNNKNIKKFKIDFVDKYYRRNCSFLPIDITTQPLGDWETVAASAMQFVLFGQPDVVYLVGCDCTQNHFDEQYDVAKNLDMSFLAEKFWPTLKKFQQIYYPDTKIISINPIGLKGLFHDVYTKKHLKEHPEINHEKLELLGE